MNFKIKLKNVLQLDYTLYFISKMKADIFFLCAEWIQTIPRMSI